MTSDYHMHRTRLLASLTVGVMAEEDNPSWDTDLTEAQVQWVAAWLAGEGFGKL